MPWRPEVHLMILAVTVLGALWYRILSEDLKAPVVSTTVGDVVGMVGTSREGRTFFQYLGIPYAKPPLGELRYEHPEPVEKWSGIFEATSYGSMCLQINSISLLQEGSEDCLTLSVFTPKAAFIQKEGRKPKKLFPVVVYIHGGYFMAGGSNYMTPLYLMNEDLVLVTVNYRLNSFGFLNTGDGTVRGNMGMKDQVLALKFVRREIAKFGGDPERITIWGESAGAAAVHFHLLSPMSKGLFKKAIMSSGTAIKPWSLSNDPVAQAKLLARTVRCPYNDSKAMVYCLKGLDASTLIQAHKDALESPIMNPLKIFAPSIETVSDWQTFLAEHPYDILKSGRAHRVPLLTGVNSHEGLLATARIYFNTTLAAQVEEFWDTLSPTFFSYDQDLTDVTKKIKDFYFGKNKKRLNFLESFENFTNVFSDRLYIHSFKETVRIQSAYSPVYVYYFSYPLQRGLTFFYDLTPRLPIHFQIILKVFMEWVQWLAFGVRPPYLGTCHGDDLVLLFNFPMVYIDVGDRDYEISRQMIDAWMTFIGDDGPPKVGNLEWPEYESINETRPKYMFFQNSSLVPGVLIDEPFAERMDFWDKLGLPWKPT